MLHQQAEQRGSLVSRVTTDVDHDHQLHPGGRPDPVGQRRADAPGHDRDGGLLLAADPAGLGLLPAAVRSRMRVASQRRLAGAYSAVRERDRRHARRGRRVRGRRPVVRAYGIEDADRRADRRGRRRHTAPRRSGPSGWSSTTFTTGEIAAGAGQRRRRGRRACCSGVGGHLTAGSWWRSSSWSPCSSPRCRSRMEVLNEAQNAIAGWRRVLGVLDAEPDVADPGEAGRDAAGAGALGVALRQVSLRLPRRAAGAARRRRRRSRRAPGSRWSGRPARARRPSPSC